VEELSGVKSLQKHTPKAVMLNFRKGFGSC
jgi:hypothetical protein